MISQQVYTLLNLTTGEITGGAGHPYGDVAGVVDNYFYTPLTAKFDVTVEVINNQLVVTVGNFAGYTYP